MRETIAHKGKTRIWSTLSAWNKENGRTSSRKLSSSRRSTCLLPWNFTNGHSRTRWIPAMSSSTNQSLRSWNFCRVRKTTRKYKAKSTSFGRKWCRCLPWGWTGRTASTLCIFGRTLNRRILWVTATRPFLMCTNSSWVSCTSNVSEKASHSRFHNSPKFSPSPSKPFFPRPPSTCPPSTDWLPSSTSRSISWPAYHPPPSLTSKKAKKRSPLNLIPPPPPSPLFLRTTRSPRREDRKESRRKKRRRARRHWRRTEARIW